MKLYEVVRSLSAMHDLFEITSKLLVSESVEVAAEVDIALDIAIETLGQMPERGRVVPELRAHGTVAFREILARRYRIIYRVVDRTVRVVAILDHRRDVLAILHDRARREVR